MNKHSKILQLLQESDISKIKIAVTDLDGVLRGKLISKEKFVKSYEELGMCNVIFGWDMNDATYDNSKVTGWHTGYPDAMASIDLNTFRKIPWNEDTPMLLGDFSRSEAIAEICPRSLLRKIRARAEEMGYSAKFANEYEWFNFTETPQTLQEKRGINPTPLTPGMFGYSVLRSSMNQSYFDDLFNLMTQFDVPIEGIHTETGDGVYEACISYSDVLEAADRATLFKTGVKEIAYRHGIIASFMAKWNKQLPGCSGHIHQSLWNPQTNSNEFFDADGDSNMSELLKSYLAGQLHCLPYILPLYAPTVNSYKRLVEGSWAATSVSWGIENRTTALRVINHKEDSMRLETRVPGSDANPYLAMAASLASGLYGIQNNLKLEIQPTTGNEYEQQTNQKLPSTLIEAIQQMKSSGLAKELFGEAFVDHFIRTREWEWKQFSGAVTDWEMKRYFEII